jgi:hypothetical protein
MHSGEIEQHVPGRIGEEFGIEEAGALLALAQHAANHARIGEIGLRTAQVDRLVRRGGAEGNHGGFDAALSREIAIPQPRGETADLLGQPQELKPVFIRHLADRAARGERKGTAQGEGQLGFAGIDEDLGAGLIKAAEHVFQAAGRGGDDQLGPALRGAQIEPGQRGEVGSVGPGAIDQDDFGTNPRIAPAKRGE